MYIYTYIYIGLNLVSLFYCRLLEQRRIDLVHSAAVVLDKCALIKVRHSTALGVCACLLNRVNPRSV